MGERTSEDHDHDDSADKHLEKMPESVRGYLEKLKHEVWSCKVGDLLELVATVQFVPREEDSDNNTPFWPEVRPEGQIYMVADLKGRGFDLELVSGEGPREIRAMNSEIPGKFRVLPHP